MFLAFFQSSIRFSTIFLFGSVGETVTEKSGNLNLGIPGVMCMGAAGGIIGASVYVGAVGTSGIEGWGATLVPILFCLIFAAIGGLIYCVLTATLRCNQNVSGLALTTFGIGFLSFFGGRAKTTGFSAVSDYFTLSFPVAEENWFTTLFLSYGCLVYIAIIIAIIAAIVLKKRE